MMPITRRQALAFAAAPILPKQLPPGVTAARAVAPIRHAMPTERTAKP